MPQAKRRKKASDVQYDTAANGPLWISADKLQALGIDPATADIGQIVADAQLVDQRVARANSAQHSELTQWAAATWPQEEAVDRLNAALALLTAAERVHRIG